MGPTNTTRLLAAPRATVRLHMKILVPPPPGRSIEFLIARMRMVYEPHGILVTEVGRQHLHLPGLHELKVGDCNLGNAVTKDQEKLFAHRDNVGLKDICIYFVGSTDSPYAGCASHPPRRPGAVISTAVTQWTLAHEVAHVLGVRPHAASRDRLMHRYSKDISKFPPDLHPSEVATIIANPLTQ